MSELKREKPKRKRKSRAKAQVIPELPESPIAKTVKHNGDEKDGAAPTLMVVNNEEPAVVIAEKPNPIVQQYIRLAAACNDLPRPLMSPTAKEYGEQFFPEYDKVYRQIQRLLD